MSIAIYVNQTSQAKTLVAWGIRFAVAEHTDLVIVVPKRQKQAQARLRPLKENDSDDNELHQSIFETIATHCRDTVILKEKIEAGYASSDHDRSLIDIQELVAQTPEDAFVDELESLNVKTLILPAASVMQSAASSGESNWAKRLYDSAACETMLIRGAPPEGPIRSLVICHQDSHAELALQRCSLLAQVNPQALYNSNVAKQAPQPESPPVDLLFVRPDDDEVATTVADQHVAKVLTKISAGHRKHVRSRVILNDSWLKVLATENLAPYQLVMIGTRSRKTIRSFFKLELKSNQVPISCAVVRPADSLGSLIRRNVKTKVRAVVPQMQKEDRVRLVDRLQEGSSFNFDFAALISLSTLIAAMGLLDDSSAVVIGAMLVAPLMTPLVGIGFALIQGNERLMKTAFRSVGMGFATAFLIGATVGLLGLMAGFEITEQMEFRDHPQIIDLLVALFSGIAGAYAMSRPGLISALPGVAIAAALVPPIATAGLAFSLGNSRLGLAALLLFFVNIVAIVLGTAATFWAVGVDTRLIKSSDGSDMRRPPMWPRYWFVAFVTLAILLAVSVNFV